MEKLIKLAVLAFTELRLAQRATSRFSAAAAACGIFGLFTGLGALGCGVAALWNYLAPRFGEAGAALWCAILLLFMTAVLFLFAAYGFRGGPNPRNEASPMIDDLVGELKRGMGQNKTSILIAALVAGLTLGAMGRK